MLTHAEAVAEASRLAGLLAAGAVQLHGLYMRLCDLLREYHLSDGEIRTVLAPHFSPPRISEFVTVSHAPDEVYRRYRAGLFGFKACLERCRGYRITPERRRVQRQISRSALRLATLAGCGEVRSSGWLVTIEREPTGLVDSYDI